MQAKLHFESKDLQLPLHYNHVIQGFIYKNISNKSFREFLHDEGFIREKRRFKLFTFSRLEGKYELDLAKKIIIFKENFSFTLATVIDDLLNDLLQTCFFSKELNFNGQNVNFLGVKIDEPKKITNKISVKTLSPIVTYSTLSISGKKRTIYHSPHEKSFQRHITENLLKKAEILGIKVKDPYFVIRPLDEEKLKENLTYFKKIIIKGWSGCFELEGSPELIEIAINCGLGAKNSQGFGCIKPINYPEHQKVTGT